MHGEKNLLHRVKSQDDTGYQGMRKAKRKAERLPKQETLLPPADKQDRGPYSLVASYSERSLKEAEAEEQNYTQQQAFEVTFRRNNTLTDAVIPGSVVTPEQAAVDSEIVSFV